ncbi:5-methylaminomethyl-2-thiouridylate-methyltransferase [Thelephora ganbajun]|uniref:5-methylaminomethyl-2-thiouridylate-methyltransferase n=1 Tax=Thelephora ganbajun TaxID=370292 RepID=A0ACB6Z3G4_THEGA|nr:5-methylaminomethyl-2-thiouridylate-methyltransferase [Thelephora ganbajun]
MSGGVDSSVTAKLMVDQGYDVTGLFMRNWDTRDESGTDKGCEWEKDWEDVQLVARHLGIPCRIVDLTKEYWNNVFQPSLRVWEAGDTPNPDVWCNKEVKFGALINHLGKDGEWLATGHYARKGWKTPPGSSTPRPQLLRSSDPTKDQNYYLSAIPEKGLERALFPLDEWTKADVRKIAEAADLPTARRDESMGICFVGQKRKFNEFLVNYLEPNPGRIYELETGEIIGTHKGLWTYTIGQGARLPGLKERYFVTSKSKEENAIYVVNGSDHPSLYKRGLTCGDWKWIWADSPPPEIDSEGGFDCLMQFRHRMDPVRCTVRRIHHALIGISFREPQKAIAEGQVAVLWDGDWCLGSGTIISTISEPPHE